jgi:hypothetical protein
MIPTRWTSFCVFAYEFSDHLCHFLDMQIQLRLYPHTHVYVYSCCGMRCGCPTFFSNTRLFLIYCLSVNHNQKHARAIYPVRSRPLLWVLFPCSCTSNLQIRCTCTFYNSHRSLKTFLEPNMSKVQCIVHSFIHSCQDNSEVWSP